MSQRILKPLDYGGLLDEAFDLYKKNFLLLTGISAVVFIPYCLILSYKDLNIIFGLFLTLLYMPLNYIISGATTYAVSRRYLGEEATILSSYRFLKKRFWAFAGTMILTSLIINLGFTLFVIPGILFYLWYIFVSQVFVLEGLSSSDARGRSSDLAKYNIWKVIVVNIITGILLILVLLLFKPLSFIIPDGNIVINMLIQALITSMIIPFYITVIVLLYYDFRVRYEGFDIEMLAQSMNQSEEKTPQTI